MTAQKSIIVKPLSRKQQLFAAEYIVDFNGTQAAIRAKYSKNTAEQQASRLLSNAKVQQEVARLMEIRVEEVKVDANYVLNRLIEIDQMDLLDIMTDDLAIKPLSDWPECWRKTISSVEVLEEFAGSGKEREFIGFVKKLKLPDKVKNLELLGRHVDVQAWKDKAEIDINLHVTLEQAIAAARQERLVN